VGKSIIEKDDYLQQRVEMLCAKLSPEEAEWYFWRQFTALNARQQEFLFCLLLRFSVNGALQEMGIHDKRIFLRWLRDVRFLYCYVYLRHRMCASIAHDVKRFVSYLLNSAQRCIEAEENPRRKFKMIAKILPSLLEFLQATEFSEELQKLKQMIEVFNETIHTTTAEDT